MIKKETFNVIEYTELENILKDNFDWVPKDYNYPYENSCNNDSYEVIILNKSKLSLEDRTFKVNDSRGPDKNFICVLTLLDELCDRGVLPVGKLLVKISW